MLYDDINVIDKELKDHLADLLFEKGIKDKQVCFQIVDLFYSSKKHLSISDFNASLGKKGLNVSKDYLELALKILIEFGFAVELQFAGEDYKRYEPISHGNHHDHFYCLKCKKIIEFSNRQLENIQDSLIFKKGWRPLFHKLEVYGLCDKCSYEDVEAIPLNYVAEENTVKIYKLKGSKEFKQRLSELGFLANEDLKVIKNSNFGPIVVEIKQSRIALGRNEAKSILVKK